MVLSSQSLGNRRIRVDVADQAQDKGKKADGTFPVSSWC